MSRGVSTVLDAALFLLLVSAAATTLAAPHGTPPAPDAEPSATVVSRVSVSVNYSLAPGAAGAPERFPRVGETFDRHAHGRLAGLLARGAVRNTTVGGTELARTSDGYERAVAAAVANATGTRTRVLTVWQPYEGADVGGRLAAGPEPPRDASVASRVLRVETAAGGARARALAAANRSGYAGVARVLANATTRVLFPREGMTNALAADYPTDRLAARRYARADRLFGADTTAAIERGDAAAANERLRRALREGYERRVRAAFDSPAAAARAVRAGEVRIVVRRWSA
ncbi:DUF7284 family protein [Halosegnis marinus]|uniref:Uncharacterized protein n=1 Tax=Halosegnis marinus TaxID=3034023 RepID=A0ABD5ZQE3_9EURY|nr:hypothetical protein [Halosegnis sp. DT85]